MGRCTANIDPWPHQGNRRELHVPLARPQSSVIGPAAKSANWPNLVRRRWAISHEGI